MSNFQYVRQRSASEERADALATLEAAARQGEDPSRFKADDVLWAVGGDQAAVNRLAAIAAEAREERGRRIREQKQRDELRHATQKILDRWDEEERTARYAKAEALAREELAR
jgi:hypothetical protein